MKTVDLIIICFTILGLLTPLVIFLIKRNFKGPKLKIEIKFKSGMEMPSGLIKKVLTQDGYIDEENSITRWEQKWNYEISIHNNSPISAYNTVFKILSSPLKFSQLENLNSFETIKGDSSISLNGEIKHYYDSNKYKRKQFKAIPVEIYGLNIFLSYENEYGSKYYTNYIIENGIQTNKTYNFRPRIMR